MNNKQIMKEVEMIKKGEKWRSCAWLQQEFRIGYITAIKFKNLILSLQKKQKQESKRVVEEMKENIIDIDAPYQGEEYRHGFNETKHKAVMIIESKLKAIDKL